MIIVNVEIHPHGRPEGSKQIMRMAIANVGPKDLNHDYYCYDAWISKEDMAGDTLGISNVQLSTRDKPDVSVVHRRDRGVTALVRTVLNEWDDEEYAHAQAANNPDPELHIVEEAAA